MKRHNAFIYWMSGKSGRVIRIVAGALLVLFGWYHITEDAGVFALIAGLIFTASGLLNFCIVAPLFHEPFFGFAIRDDDPMARF